MAFTKGLTPAPIVLRTGKLYGIPTVSSARSFLQSAPQLRTRPKTHFLRRAREGIPWPLFEFVSMQMPPPGPDVIFEFHNSRSLNGAVMACAGRILVWWDRDYDAGGRPIRPDVREAGRDLWEQACQQTMAAFDDHSPAAELMEYAVAQVSRYLDRIGAPMTSRKHGLVMVAFCRALRRYRAKLGRLELVGGSYELAQRAPGQSWEAEAHTRLEFENLVRRLSRKNADVLMLRAAGYEWKDIATLLGVSAAALRNAFWREIDRLRSNLGGTEA